MYGEDQMVMTEAASLTSLSSSLGGDSDLEESLRVGRKIW